MYTIPMKSLRSRVALDLGHHVNIGSFAGSISEPAIANSVEVDVIKTD